VFALALALLILALLVIMMLLVEVRQYRAGRRLLSARRFALRIIAGVLLLALLGVIFAGLFVLRLTHAEGNVRLFLSFWGGCALMAIALVWVMVADLQEMRKQAVRRQHEIWRDFARYIADSVSPNPRGRESPGKDESEDEPG
jgi:hypothetical protein